jgi:hypothetical protein
MQYFSWAHNRYFFTGPYGPDPNDFVCAARNSIAETIIFDNYPTVTLCPNSFGRTDQQPDGATVRRLGGVTPVAISNSAYEQQVKNKNLGGLQTLDAVLSTAATLYHETFHVVLGAGDGVSKPSNGIEVYGVTPCLALAAASAMKNPETYAYVANAWWMTQNKKDANGNVVEYFSGYSTYSD